MLNGDKTEEIFWPAEEKIRKIGEVCGGACKIFVIYDCCRDDYFTLKASVEKQLLESAAK